MARQDVVRPKSVREILNIAHHMSESSEPQPERVRQLAYLYRKMDPEQRATFFEGLVQDLGMPAQHIQEELTSAVNEIKQKPNATAQIAAQLRRGLKSPLRRFIEGFFNIPTGLQLLITGRADILDAQREGVEGIDFLEVEIAEVLTGWFSRGLLSVHEIDEASPYRLIRYLKQHEMVHPMVSLDEMAARLGHDRHCFGLFHKFLPDEPVVFVETALTQGIPQSIHEILEQPPIAGGPSPDTAIFYSINATQNGLSGLGLAKELIFRVTEELKRRHASLKTFATLSPMPRFRQRYLQPLLAGETKPGNRSVEDVAALLSTKAQEALREELTTKGTTPPENPGHLLLFILDDDTWLDNPVYTRWLQKPLVDIAYHYLNEERDTHGRPLCPVANFHLGNGATISRRTIHFAANRTPRGMRESCGLMVSYVYSESWFRSLRRSLGI